MTAVVEVWRGAVVESEHQAVLAVVDGSGRVRMQAGDIGRLAFARSAVKPIQAIPLIDDGVADRFTLTAQDLALCCASHNAEAIHIDGVHAMLRRFGLTPDALECGPHVPLGESAARALRDACIEPQRIHNNCSGKHAGMLGLAVTHGWTVEGYTAPEHPVQRRMLAEMSRWTGAPQEQIPIAVDGCGAATFALSVQAMAHAFAGLARAARDDEGAAAIVLNAMAQHPDYVAGEKRLCTALMTATEGRIIAKVGAEGVYCAAVPGAELGVSLKVVDGATRAAEAVLIAVLRSLTLLSDAELASLQRWAEPVITNTRGERVGSIQVRLGAERA